MIVCRFWLLCFIVYGICLSFSGTDSHAMIFQNRDLQSQEEKPAGYWSEKTQFNSKIPTPREHFGFEIGHRHLDYSQVISYIRRVVDSSERLSMRQYATSHGGRPLFVVTATSLENRKRLKQIQRQHWMLSQPGSGDVDLQNLPAVINMGYGVHGDEPSATNCTPLVLYYLAAAETDEVKQWLDNCVILLDPALNPDGFNRFANWANRYRGTVVNPDPRHAEHNQMWPSGRVNYYWFDLNRDWLPLVHPESRGRMGFFHRWKPNVVLDFHEMGSGSTYFFQPGIPARTNPLTPKRNQELTGEFAKFHAKRMDGIGSLYFTKERFDDFYMGKGSTYPDLHGSIGILFEQASSRGQVQKTDNGVLEFRDTIKNQLTTSLSSLEATTALRKQLLQYQRSFYQGAMRQAAKAKVQTYVFRSNGNESRLEKLAALFTKHDIQCFRLAKDIAYGDENLTAKGTLVVPAEQPEYRFLQSLLQRRTDFRENIFYDVSTWTIPFAYGLEQLELKQKIGPENLLRIKARQPGTNSNFEFDETAIAYAIDFTDDVACELLIRLLRSKVDTRVAMKPFETTSNQNREAFGRGTLVVHLKTQKNKLKQIGRLLNAYASRLRMVKITSGLSAAGPDMGSSNYRQIQLPKLAMLSGPSVSSYGAGEVWHYLNHVLKMPVTILKDRNVTAHILDDYTCLIVPDGSLSESNREAVHQYASQGGNVVVVGRQAVAMQQQLRESADSEQASGEETSQTELGSIQQPFDSASNTRALQLISGAIFSTEADLTHPLLFGVSKKKQVAVFRNHNMFLKPSTNVYRNPLIYSKKPLLAGYCSSENLPKFENSASVVVESVGKGQMILMADNPNFRGFWHSTRRIFFNAVFWGEKSM